MKSKNPTFFIIAIFVLAILIRGIFVFVIHPPEKYLQSDMKSYYSKAVKLSQGQKETIFDSFHPPGTHYLYSVFFRLSNPFFWIKIFNILASVAACFFIYESTKLLFNQKSARMALVMSSFNYLFIDLSGYFLSETPFILGLSAMAYFLFKSIKTERQGLRNFYSFLTGLSIILSASFRSCMVLFFPFLCIWWFINRRKYNMKSNLIFYSLGFFPLLILMLLRVFALTGKWGEIATYGGQIFYANRVRAAHITYYDVENNVRYGIKSPVFTQKNYSLTKRLDVGPYDSGFLYREGLKEVRWDMAKAVWYSLENVSDLFYSTVIWPTSDLEGILPKIIKYYNTVFVYLVVFPAGILFIVRLKRMTKSLKIIPYLAILIIIIQALVFAGDPRYRVPFDIFFIMLSSYFYSVILPAFIFIKKKRQLQVIAH